MEEKDLKTKIQEKLDERIESILSKSELTEEEYKILSSRLLELKQEEDSKRFRETMINGILSK